MHTKLVRIGNSRGVRIPRPLLESAGLTDEVEMTLEGSALVLRPPALHPRNGWAEAFEQMHVAGDDELLEAEVGSDFDELEWQWP
ncbi:MAG: AbrB/MazE/SpoVT family DNA-binding domain-containing protein [bacterium]